MQRSLFKFFLLCVITCLVVVAMTPTAFGQYTQGKITVIVFDPQKAVVPGANLELVDMATNGTRAAVTQSAGTFTFVNLPPGNYRLTVSHEGFQKAVYDVVVEGTKSTDIEAMLKVGAPTQIVTVEGAATPVVEATQVSIGAVINMKQIEDLPVSGRNIQGLARIVPGYNGTWNGLPSIAQGNNVDGVIGSSSRMKFGGNSAPAVQVRLENIEEMTVQTDQMDENQGFGMAAMQSNFTTRRGTSVYHGQFFEDLRNDNLNANSWSNNTRGLPRAEFKLNEFGGSLGGPVPKFKDKLFFFFSLSTARQPGGSALSANILTAAAQQGNFNYVGTDGKTHTVNVLTAAKAFDATLPSTLNSVISNQLSRVNGVSNQGVVNTTTDLNVNSLSWLGNNPTTSWFPTLRVDYTPTSKLRFNVAINWTKITQPYANPAFFPGDTFASSASGTFTSNASNSVGIDWTASPTLLNSFRFGWLYNATKYDPNANPDYKTVAENVGWPLVTTPMQYRTPITTYYPVFNFGDTVSWMKGAHALSLGFTFYREQDHYWNPPELTNTSLGLVEGDPALNALSNAGSYQPLPFASTDQQGEAQNLYALLTGRISDIEGSFPYDAKTGGYIQKRALAYNLNEVGRGGGIFAQDNWRLRPNLSLNLGLRWDFTAPSYDKGGAYHSADLSSLYGPSGIGNLFKPGTLTGNNNPTLEVRQSTWQGWYVTPQPSLGLAWTPKYQEGILKKLLGGGDQTVIRSSFSLRRFSVPYQYFWNTASNYGSFFYQFYTTTARQGVTGDGSFTPGSLSLGQTYPKYLLLPAQYQKSEPMADFTFNNGQYNNGSNGFNDHISQPYTMSWTWGIQRKLGESRALEIRYNGNRTLKQWIQQDLNEVNVFENGFLQEFRNAQANLAANGGGSFANLKPGAGTVPVPILTAAFTGSKDGSQTNSNFRSGSLITRLNTGAVGAMANTLTQLPYFCNLVGASFTPCATNAGYTGAGGGYPINFFQANPYASGIPSLVMTDAGWSTYHSMQVDFRQRNWHGLAFDANYTWSHTLGVSTPNDWTGAYYAYTLRDMEQSYGPTLYDARHTFNLSGTADLPFGIGKQWANSNRMLDKVIGGWTVGTITTYRSGYPFRLLGGYSTFNNIADGGVTLNGVTTAQLQDAVGVYKTGANFVQLIDPKYRTAGVGANTSYIKANTIPGYFSGVTWLHGPGGIYCDLSLTKQTAITERLKFTLQAQFLNAFNHPVFGTGTNPVGANVRGSSWATTTGSSTGPRAIEIRANFSF
jgi:hypothetical protein